MKHGSGIQVEEICSKMCPIRLDSPVGGGGRRQGLCGRWGRRREEQEDGQTQEGEDDDLKVRVKYRVIHHETKKKFWDSGVSQEEEEESSYAVCNIATQFSLLSSLAPYAKESEEGEGRG